MSTTSITDDEFINGIKYCKSIFDTIPDIPSPVPKVENSTMHYSCICKNCSFVNTISVQTP